MKTSLTLATIAITALLGTMAGAQQSGSGPAPQLEPTLPNGSPPPAEITPTHPLDPKLNNGALVKPLPNKPETTGQALDPPPYKPLPENAPNQAR